jgi:drug/metabolite transporter (DMT)-like permease
MDTTSFGIAAGVVASLAYACIGFVYKKTFDLNHTVLIFLAAFSLPGGIGLIVAGFKGNSVDLPSSWREYVVVAGIVAIGLAIHYIFDAFRGCLQLTNKPAEVNAKKDEGER